MIYSIEIFCILPIAYYLPIFTFRVLFNYRPKMKQLLPYLLCCAVAVQVLYQLMTEEAAIITRSIILVVAITVLLFAFFRERPAQLAASLSLAIFLLIIFEICAYFIFFVVTPSFLQQYDKALTIRMNLPTFMAPYIIVLVIGQMRKSMRIKKQSRVIMRFLTILFPVLVLASAFIIALEIERVSLVGIKTQGVEPLFIYVAVLIVSTIISCALTLQLAWQVQRKNETLLKYQKTITDLYDSTRLFRHNYKNVLLMLNGYFREGDYENIERVLKGMNEEYAAVYSSEYAEGVASIQDAGLRWLLISKLVQAQSLCINCAVHVAGGIENVSLTPSELAEIIGILLDNAIESAAVSEKKLAGLELVNEGGVFTATVRNTFRVMPDINRIFEKEYSTKGGHAGLGLYRVKQILDRNQSALTDVKVQDGYFIFSLSL
jgi:two-component system, LytTR family, sensor histidine kinase AgrC